VRKVQSLLLSFYFSDYKYLVLLSFTILILVQNFIFFIFWSLVQERREDLWILAIEKKILVYTDFDNENNRFRCQWLSFDVKSYSYVFFPLEIVEKMSGDFIFGLDLCFFFF